MDKNKDYIKNVNIQDIPWHKMVTTYGRATDFPRYFDDIKSFKDEESVRLALKEIIYNTEHQSTVWHSTPFAMVFLVRIFNHISKTKDEKFNFVIEGLIELFNDIVIAYIDGSFLEHEQQLDLFEDMLKEDYLWSEIYDEEEDEIRWEEEDVFPDDLFYSFYYYSYMVLLENKFEFESLKNSIFKEKIEKLLDLLN